MKRVRQPSLPHISERQRMNFSLSTTLVLCFSVLLLSFGCRKTGSGDANRHPTVLSFTFPERQTAPNDSLALSLDSLRNALINTTDYGSIRLSNGEYSIDPLRLSISFLGGFINLDLDGDGYKDAIGSLSINTGSSGCFNSLDIFLNRRGTAYHSDSYEIGDRERIDSLRVMGDTLDVFFLVHGPGDPMSSPTMTEERRLLFVGGKIVEIE